MGIKRTYAKSDNVYTVSYMGMRGVDFSSVGGNAKRYRFARLENMYKDYEGGGAEITESIPGFRKILSLEKRIHAIYTHKNSAGEEYAVVHAGDSLYRFALSERDSLNSQSAIITLNDGKSHAFVSGSDLFVLDGQNIIRVDEKGNAERFGEGNSKPYIPTTYYNGEEYEQRNLLTDEFRETCVISAAADLAAGTGGLKYEILSVAEGTCAVVGIEDGIGGTVYIPNYVNIADKKYTVTEIADKAFYHNAIITKLILSDSVKRIGNLSFASCAMLTEVITKNGITLIDHNAFLGCSALERVYLGANLQTVGASSFAVCSSLKEFNYAADAESFKKIDFYTDIDYSLVRYGVVYSEATVEIPVFTPAKTVTSVYTGARQFTFSTKTRGTRIISVFITVANKYELDGLEITVQGLADTTVAERHSEGEIFTAYNGDTVSGLEAIKGCTVCESFDGRVFLSGNKSLPNTVFYSSRDLSGKNNPFYFGVFNYFNDGTGSFGVESMLAAGESLAVFKSGDDGGGSIYYHTPKETGINILPKIYPVSYIHSGIAAVGESVSFFDDPVFISALGVSALDKKMINLERSVAVRSHNVNSLLLSENLKDISLAKWCGYLFILAGEHAYLADSRSTFTHTTGNTEYEWYYLTGIGTYKDDRRVYRYSSIARNGYNVHEKTDCIAESLVGSTTHPDGNIIYFTIEKGIRYEVYLTTEMYGGTFSPASCIFGTEDNLLLFGTESGDICIFNNDMRGIAPPALKEMAGFNEKEYKKSFGRRIHPYYYSFANHSPRYSVKTVADDGSFPHATKNTEKHSLTVKLRSLGCKSLVCEAGTEKNGYREVARLPDCALDFSEFDFSALSFSNNEYVTLPLKEKEKGWIEKTVSFYSKEYCSPFGICTVTYRFKLKGKIKY